MTGGQSTGVSVGFFTPRAMISDMRKFGDRVRGFMPMRQRGFPLAIEHFRDGELAVSYMLISGNVPIHIENPIDEWPTSAMFHFVMETENRPALLVAPATPENAQAILQPDMRSKFGVGALELRQGGVIHFDVSRCFHGFLGLPTGDAQAMIEEPTALVLQLAFSQATAIQYAVSKITQALRADARVKDLVL